MIGRQQPTFHDMPAFLAHGVKQLAYEMEAPDKNKVERLLKDFDEVAVCKATGKSQLASLRAVAADYSHHAREKGGKVEIGSIVSSVNSLPRKSLGYESSFEVTRELLRSSDA